MNNNIDFYNRNADDYYRDTVNLDMSSWIERFLEHIPKGGNILDAGCGSGRDSKIFISKGFSVVSIDGSLEMCKLASRYIGQPVLNLCFEDLSYDNQFDGVWACASLLHISREKMEFVLKLLKNSLKKDGVIYASYKYGDSDTEKEGRNFSNFTEGLLYEIFTNVGFRVIEVELSEELRSDNTIQKWVNIIAIKDLY